MEEEEEKEDQAPFDEEQYWREKAQSLRDFYNENQALYGDPDFPPNEKSLYKDPANLPDYA